MNKINVTRVMIGAVCATALLAAGGLATGCKSQKQAIGESTSVQLKTFQQSLEQMPGRIDRLMATGTLLASGTNTNRAGTLAEFSRQLGEVRTDAKDIAHEYDTANANVNRYFRAWVKESRTIKDPAARDRALAAIDEGRINTATAQNYMKQASTYYFRMIDAAQEIEKGLGGGNLDKAFTPWFDEKFTAFSDAAVAARARVERLDELITQTLTGEKK